jgi:MFS family permease
LAPRLSGPVSFWLVALLLALCLFAASAPSPLYGVYAALWHFSPVTLTAIYAMYSAGALAALLTTGRLSDHVGRRRVVAFALVVQIAGAVAFIVAENVGALYIGRALQGIGTGVAIGPLSAWLLDLRPQQDRGFGGLVGAVAPVAGLAAGALVSGALVQYAPEPLRLVFWVLAGAFAVLLFAISRVPDPAVRSAGWLGSMRPRVGVPNAARSLFAALVPSVIAMWALAALYLALGPSLALTLLGTENRLVGGSVIAALMGAGAVASAFGRTADPRLVVIRGSIAIITGVAITLIAVAARSVVGLYAGTLIAGIGFGPAFGAVVRGLTPLAPPDKRSALFAALYVVLYFALSVPTVIAGVAVTRYGLHETTYAYGAVVMVLAAVTTVAISRRTTSPETASMRRIPPHESGS